jgi:Cys-rich protein (TIGR01571 family)
MSRHQYPRVNPPSSFQQPLYTTGQDGIRAEVDIRPYSWVNAAREPEDGRFRHPSTTSHIPPLPRIPDHLNPALQSQQVVHPQPAEPASSTPAYPIDQKIELHEYSRHPLQQQSHSDPQQHYHKSTPSNTAPEVFSYKYHHPASQNAVAVVPDENPLSPTISDHPPAWTNTTNMAVIPSNEPVPLTFPSNLFQPVHVTQGGTWKHSLFSCADTTTCLSGLCCPCILYGKTQYRLTQRSEKKDPTNLLGYSMFNGSCAAFAVLCGCNFILAVIQHSRVRRAYKMDREAGGAVHNCVKALCCCCCTLAQDEKEVKWREMEARTGAGESLLQQGTMQYQTPGGMRYPGPQR